MATAEKNKVNFGLAKSGWFKITTNAQGKDEYGPIAMFVGNRQINFTATGDMVNVYADGTIILTGKQNSGYTGTIESTSLDDDFLAYILGEMKNDKNVQYEMQEVGIARFGLVWEWVQDAKNTRHVMYNITANRPDVSATTAGDGGSKTAQYQTLNLTAIPRLDGLVKAKTRHDVDEAVYGSWFTTAYDPTVIAPGG